MRICSSICLVWLAPCLALAGLQNNNAAAKAALQAQYDRLTKAYLNKDLATASAVLAPDYSSGDYNHILNKRAALEQLKTSKSKFRTVSRTVLNVVVNGRMATAMVDTVTKGALTDSAGKHQYVINTRSMDTWEQNAQGWQIKHSRPNRLSMTKDGKPLHGKMTGK